MSSIPNLTERRANKRRYSVLATTINDIRASQALHYRIFAQDFGAKVKGAAQGCDEDAFDPCCRHLLVREGTTGRIVATIRLLPDKRAEAAGGFHSSTEFELGPVLSLHGRRPEIGAAAATTQGLHPFRRAPAADPAATRRSTVPACWCW